MQQICLDQIGFELVTKRTPKREYLAAVILRIHLLQQFFGHAKNDKGEHVPEMRQPKKGNQWYFEIKARQELPALPMVAAC